jgi:hypothetical protein
VTSDKQESLGPQCKFHNTPAAASFFFSQPPPPLKHLGEAIEKTNNRPESKRAKKDLLALDFLKSFHVCIPFLPPSPGKRRRNHN